MADEFELDSGEIEVTDENVVDPPAAAPVDEKPERTSPVAVIGKTITLANLILSLVFLSVALFYRANKIELVEKKRTLEATTRELTTLEEERQQVVAGLKQEIEAAQKKLDESSKNGEREIADLESRIAQVRQSIATARDEQALLVKDVDRLHDDQKTLITAIVELREKRENTRTDEEGLDTDRGFIEDQLAKTLGELSIARARRDEVQQRLAELKGADRPPASSTDAEASE